MNLPAARPDLAAAMLAVLEYGCASHDDLGAARDGSFMQLERYSFI